MSPLKSVASALTLGLLAGCGGSDAVGTGAGSIHVVVSPATTPFDQDGFAVRLDNGSPRTIPAAGDIVIDGVDAGAHTLQLTDVDLPCQVTGVLTVSATLVEYFKTLPPSQVVLVPNRETFPEIKYVESPLKSRFV